MNQTVQNIMGRRSIRTFKAGQISEEELRAILDAGTAAPSSMNRQPWHFTVIQNKMLIDQMVEDNKKVVFASPELTKINRWINAPEYHNFYHAPTVILISGEQENIWHICDCALALENMSLAAWSMAVGSCIVVSTRFLFTGDKAGEYRDRLGIPAGYAPLYALALGYIDGEEPQPTPRKDHCVHFIS